MAIVLFEAENFEDDIEVEEASFEEAYHHFTNTYPDAVITEVSVKSLVSKTRNLKKIKKVE